MNLVTGAAGHLGNVLVRELLKRDEAVRVLVLPGENTAGLDSLPVETVYGNILDVQSLEPACRNVTTVFHLAALVSLLDKDEPVMRRVNIEGTQNILRAAQTNAVQRFVYTSSIHALARPAHGVKIDEAQPFDARNSAGAYDRTKAEASLAVLQAASRGLHAVIVCPTGVIGPYDYRRSEMGEMILGWMLSPFHWLVKGSFDFVDVRDVAKGHIRARDHGRSGETYILGGNNIDIRRLVGMVANQTGRQKPSVRLPGWIAMLAAGAAEQYYRVTHTRPSFTRYSLETLLSNSTISSHKAQRELGYLPRELSETISDTITWWLEHKRVVKASVRI